MVDDRLVNGVIDLARHAVIEVVDPLLVILKCFLNPEEAVFAKGVEPLDLCVDLLRRRPTSQWAMSGLMAKLTALPASTAKTRNVSSKPSRKIILWIPPITKLVDVDLAVVDVVRVGLCVRIPLRYHVEF